MYGRAGRSFFALSPRERRGKEQERVNFEPVEARVPAVSTVLASVDAPGEGHALPIEDENFYAL